VDNRALIGTVLAVSRWGLHSILIGAQHSHDAHILTAAALQNALSTIEIVSRIAGVAHQALTGA